MPRVHSSATSAEYKLPKAIVGWIHNHASKNYWRVANYCELDDLIQDGLLKAYQCRRRYGRPGKDIDAAHFMALVKTAFYRHITEILRTSRAEQELVCRVGDVSGEMSDDRYLDARAEPVQPAQDFAALIAGMPEALRRAVRLYLDNPEKLRTGHLDETDAQRLKRLCGFPVRLDFETELRAYLWEAESLA